MTYENPVESYTDTGDHAVAKPKKPTAALATGLWTLTGLHIKRGYIDEAQMINKRDGKRQLALMQLQVSSWCLMSGTLAHNRWHDLGGYLDFARAYPYTTDESFMQQFAARSYTTSSFPGHWGPAVVPTPTFSSSIHHHAPTRRAQVASLPKNCVSRGVDMQSGKCCRRVHGGVQGVGTSFHIFANLLNSQSSHSRWVTQSSWVGVGPPPYTSLRRIHFIVYQANPA
jgi:hypothetical protein